ncbi:MAG: hypothetical protein IH948_04375 [Bacteroidetes bacterium]|nr:hypothetical protein [Bacteroidota bacterium]
MIWRFIIIALLVIFVHRAKGQDDSVSVKPFHHWIIKTGLLNPLANNVTFEVETNFFKRTSGTLKIGFSHIGMKEPFGLANKLFPETDKHVSSSNYLARAPTFFIKTGMKFYLSKKRFEQNTLSGFAIKPELFYSVTLGDAIKEYNYYTPRYDKIQFIGFTTNLSYQFAYKRISIEPFVGFGVELVNVSGVVYGIEPNTFSTSEWGVFSIGQFKISADGFFYSHYRYSIYTGRWWLLTALLFPSVGGINIGYNF